MTVEEIYLQAKSTKANGIGSKNQEWSNVMSNILFCDQTSGTRVEVGLLRLLIFSSCSCQWNRRVEIEKLLMWRTTRRGEAWFRVIRWCFDNCCVFWAQPISYLAHLIGQRFWGNSPCRRDICDKISFGRHQTILEWCFDCGYCLAPDFSARKQRIVTSLKRPIWSSFQLIKALHFESVFRGWNDLRFRPRVLLSTVSEALIPSGASH